MTVKYLVCSPGRSGSIFVALTISLSLGVKTVMSNQEPLPDTSQPLVYHSHDAQLQLPDHDIQVVHVTRRNLFGEITSAIICEQYNEWFNYSGQGLPFVADLNMFEEKYNWHKYWHHAHQSLTQYQNRHYLTFEDFIGRSEVICSELNIPIVKNVRTQKSPYSSSNILNIHELLQKFLQLESQAAPEIVAEHWKDRQSK
jgi:hypothetical protein